jgi:hypothetical protein
MMEPMMMTHTEERRDVDDDEGDETVEEEYR